MFPLESVQLPPYLKNDLDDCADILRHRWLLGFQKFHALMAAGGVPMWRQWVQAYLACMAFADEQVGTCSRRWTQAPTATIRSWCSSATTAITSAKRIAFRSGTFGKNRRRCLSSFGRRALRGQNLQTPTSLIDLYPTLIELCGLPKSPNAGKSEPRWRTFSAAAAEDPQNGTWDGPPAALS